MISEMESKGELGRHARVQIVQKPFSDTAFTVLTMSPDLVPQVLTPDFVEFLIATGRQFSYNRRHLFFMGKQAHIGINTGRDLFEPCSNMRNATALRTRIQEEIDYIKEIIDGFLRTSLFTTT